MTGGRTGLGLAIVLMVTVGGTDVAGEQLVRLGDYQALVADRVVVRKAERRLELWRDGAVVRSFYAALGRNPSGPKRQQGDGRTPEGTYVLDWRNPNSRFYRSIHVSYPNDDDRARAAGEGVATGGMIMIHGAPNNPRTGDYGLKPDWTEGCIAVTNDAMDEIWAAVPDGTPIDILP